MKKYEQIYKELKKQYTDQEIVDAMLIPEDLSEEEMEKANQEMRAFRFNLLKQRTEEQRIFSDLMRFRFQIEDYLDNQAFTADKSFGKHLEEYARILKKTKKQLSEDLDVHYTRLSRLINDREDSNTELTYRLEEHSGKLIPALIWWKLIIKKQAYLLQKDHKTRKKEAARVNNAVEVKA